MAARDFARIDAHLARSRADIAIAGNAPRLLVEALGLLALVAVAWWLTQRSGGLASALPMLAALALDAQRLLSLAQTLSQALGETGKCD